MQPSCSRILQTNGEPFEIRLLSVVQLTLNLVCYCAILFVDISSVLNRVKGYIELKGMAIPEIGSRLADFFCVQPL